MGLLERIAQSRTETRYSADQYITDYLLPTSFGYGGIQYQTGFPGLKQTLAGNRAAEIVNTLPGYAAALRGCPPAFAAQMVRALVLSQARFTFRNKAWTSTPRRLFGTSALSLLEQPWRNATTGELLARMEWHAGLAGNAFVARRPDRLRVLRPDWVAIVYGSDLEPEDPGHAIDGDIVGYVYWNQGPGGGYKPTTLLPTECAHWSPIPDAESPGLGMSWITPAIRDMQGDRLASEHKIRYFENGATPNLVVKGINAATKEQFDDIVGMLDRDHSGVANAYRTLYLTAGADATVVGSNLKDLDLKSTQGGNETRVAFLSRVPAPILGIAEGLAGSSLNAGNFGMARRIFADSWVYPTLQDVAAALAPLVRVPSDAELWFDTADIPLLREDGKDAADIALVKASAIRQLGDGGWNPDAATATIAPEWTSTLKHTGKLSVQLQEPGAEEMVTKSEAERLRQTGNQEGRDHARMVALEVQVAEKEQRAVAAGHALREAEQRTARAEAHSDVASQRARDEAVARAAAEARAEAEAAARTRAEARAEAAVKAETRAHVEADAARQRARDLEARLRDLEARLTLSEAENRELKLEARAAQLADATARTDGGSAAT